MKTYVVLFTVVLSVLVQVSAQARTLRGQVHHVDLEDNLITLRSPRTGVLQAFEVTPDTTLKIGSQQTQDLAYLKVGEEVTYREGIITKAPRTVAAEIRAIDVDNREVTFVVLETGRSVTAPIDPALLASDDRDQIDPAGLKPGEKIDIEIVGL